jgi:hypothetical protein
VVWAEVGFFYVSVGVLSWRWCVVGLLEEHEEGARPGMRVAGSHIAIILGWGFFVFLSELWTLECGVMIGNQEWGDCRPGGGWGGSSAHCKD